MSYRVEFHFPRFMGLKIADQNHLDFIFISRPVFAQNRGWILSDFPVAQNRDDCIVCQTFMPGYMKQKEGSL